IRRADLGAEVRMTAARTVVRVSACSSATRTDDDLNPFERSVGLRGEHRCGDRRVGLPAAASTATGSGTGQQSVVRAGRTTTTGPDDDDLNRDHALGGCVCVVRCVDLRYALENELVQNLSHFGD